MTTKAILPAFLLLAVRQAQAADGACAGNSAYIARIGMVRKWNRSRASGERWQVIGAWRIVAYSSVSTGARGRSRCAPFRRWLSRPAPVLQSLHAGRQEVRFGFSVRACFGVGADLGDCHQCSMSYRFQHMPAGGMVEPNQGVNLSELHIARFFMMEALSLSSIPALGCRCSPVSAGG
ncbi:MAG TPA: acyloxyacyl hydrolase [Gallionellaceae bacterium]|nr:acyloxyacyl hydrolase [Gallionellaceae bacterium]